MENEKGMQGEQIAPGYQATGYPPQQPGYPPQQPGYPPQQPGYPPQQPGYPPQQPGYPPQQTGYPPAYSGQQPTTAPTVYGQQPGMVGAPNTIYVANRSYLNFTGAIVLSCVVYWCCGMIFGLIAFILAMIGQSSASSGDNASAKSLLTASYITSAVGIVVAIIMIIIMIIVVATSPKQINYKTNHISSDWNRNNWNTK